MRKFLIVLLCICTLFLCFVIPSFAMTSQGGSVIVPTDLTGYTVTVPAGWSASAGYGEFVLNFSFSSSFSHTSGSDYVALNVGYRQGEDGFGFLSNVEASNYICVGQTIYELPFNTKNDEALTFVFTGGNDVDNPNLIQWLVNNNATFDNGEPEPDPNPAVTLSAGNYYFNPSITYPYLSEWFDDGYTYSYDCDDGYYYIGSLPHHFGFFNFEFKSLTDDQNYHLVFSVDTDSGEIVPLYDIFCVNGRYTVDSLDGLTYFSLEEDVVLDLNSRTTFEHFFKTYAPDTPVFDGNPWSYILEMVIEALKIKIWGYFSVWDIVTTLCGIFIATWLLKLLAGG